VTRATIDVINPTGLQELMERHKALRKAVRRFVKRTCTIRPPHCLVCNAPFAHDSLVLFALVAATDYSRGWLSAACGRCCGVGDVGGFVVTADVERRMVTSLEMVLRSGHRGGSA
jgi:hypothetical protein